MKDFIQLFYKTAMLQIIFKKRGTVYCLLTFQKMQKLSYYNRKEQKTRKMKKGIDKVGEDEYNSQCCREGRERERAAERHGAILENDIEKNEEEETVRFRTS